MRRLSVFALALLPLFARAPATGGPEPEPEAQEAFRRLTDEYVAFHAYFNPVEATSLGIHDYDGRLPDLSQDGLFSLVAAYHEWLDRLASIDRESLSGDAYWDHRILEYGIRDRILDIEQIRWWERNPLAYVDRVTGGLAALAHGSFAPATERMESVTARERQLPELLEQARTNLLAPPRVLTELAIESARGAVRLVRDDIPRAFDDVEEGPARDNFERINRRTVEELRRFEAWLEEELLPDSRGDAHLAPELLERKLRLHEHLDVPLGVLERLVDEDVDRYRRWIESEARALDPSRPPSAVIRDSGAPTRPDSLQLGAEADTREARAFVVEEDLLTVPDGPLPRVEPLPPYRIETTASLSWSGPFEGETGLEARYLLALPRDDWTEDQRRAHLKLLSRPALLTLTAGETYPGRWVEHLHLRRVPSRIRKVFQPDGLDGGWADYAQEMAVDRGLGGGDPSVRIAQLRAALIELARLRTALRTDGDDASLEDETRIFQDVAYMDSFPALREARRIAANPLAGAGWLGKMQIAQLRADYQGHLAADGEIYVLGNFHDRLLRLGVPVPLARRILLPGDERPSLREER